MRLRNTSRLCAAIFLPLAAVLFTLVVGEPFKCEYQRTGQRLSEMSEEECLRFIEEGGVEIPPRLNGPYRGGLIKDLICFSEQDPACDFGMLSSSETIELGYRVRKAVNEYYGIKDPGIPAEKFWETVEPDRS